MGTFVDDMYPTSKDDESNISESWECPTVVSHVCSRWRNCALATPNLWTRILWEEEMSFDKATTWIARSKAALLEIDLLFSKENATTDGVSKQITEALSILLPHLHRWYGIDIQFETYASLFQVLKALEGKEAPELRHLMLSYDGKEDYNEALFPPISFLNGPGSAPRLQSVTLWETPVSLSDFPWNSTLMSQLDIDYSPEGTYLCKPTSLFILTFQNCYRIYVTRFPFASNVELLHKPSPIASWQFWSHLGSARIRTRRLHSSSDSPLHIIPLIRKQPAPRAAN